MIIGMDFGTTNSGIATYDGQHLRLIPIDGSSTVTRTALYVTNDRQFTIGRSAIDTYFQQNLNRPVRIERAKVGEIQLTFAEIGTFFRDVWVDKDVLSPGRLFVSFKTALSSLDYIGTVVGSHFYFLEDIIALYLYIAKQHAEAALQTEIKQIALGRPVRFAFKPEDDALARERLLKAAFRAGYEEVYLQYEPIAAAYSYEASIDHEQIVLVFDFGGGTLDLSVLRVGNPKTRAVLATGGVPIAGDIFDSKLSRARLPKHFGEGSTYRSGGQRLPVPSAFYEAFANWQEMLTLQRPDLFGEIERIEQTAQRPQQIRALLNLISSSYGLKMFDIVEGAKRQLSQTDRAAIKLEGKGFNVYEPVTRPEFEAIIGPETRADRGLPRQPAARGGHPHRRHRRGDPHRRIVADSRLRPDARSPLRARARPQRRYLQQRDQRLGHHRARHRARRDRRQGLPRPRLPARCTGPDQRHARRRFRGAQEVRRLHRRPARQASRSARSRSTPTARCAPRSKRPTTPGSPRRA